MSTSTTGDPEKQTVALDEEELEILDAIRKAAPRHRIGKKMAQTYGVWTVCFRRYCQEEEVPWLWMSSVSDFMDFLDNHPNVSTTERDRALDGIMFYITDVHKKRQEDEGTADEDSSSIPRSTQSLFAKILLRCDVRLTQALQMRRKDVHLDEATVVLPGDGDENQEQISLPSTLNEGLKHHLKRVEDSTTSTNPFLFRNRGESDDEDGASDSSEESIERSTELATRVMQAFGENQTETDNSDEA
jgi:hypothetical protein